MLIVLAFVRREDVKQSFELRDNMEESLLIIFDYSEENLSQVGEHEGVGG